MHPGDHLDHQDACISFCIPSDGGVLRDPPPDQLYFLLVNPRYFMNFFRSI